MTTFVLVDGDHLAYRNYFKLRNLSYQGQLTGCFFGFLQSIKSLIVQFEIKPIIFWSSRSFEYWREREFKEYKNDRPKKDMPGFSEQLTDLYLMLSALGILQYKVEGVEADDLIASYVEYTREIRDTIHRDYRDYKIYIVSGDKDFLQLVDSNVSIVHPKRGIYDTAKVIEDYGFEPKLIPDYLALTGDKSDNIPGIKSIGEKTAKALIQMLSAFELWEKNLLILPEEFKKKHHNAINKIIIAWDDALKFRRLIQLRLPEYSWEEIIQKNYLVVKPDKNLADHLFSKNGVVTLRYEDFVL